MRRSPGAGKSALKGLLPDPWVTAGSRLLDRSLPSRRGSRAATRYHRELERLASELVAIHGPIVQGGPFAGLRLPTKASWGSLVPLLVGSYEAELHGVIEEVIESRPRQIINVGCAEGYYAVGLARRLPEADVYAFDIDERGQELARETAQINGVDKRVQIAGACTVEGLEQLLTTGTLVIMDCEGCELDLLHPECAPSLRGATLLVELHDFLNPQTSSVILARFRRTHSTQLLRAHQRTITDYAVLRDLAASDRAAALDEERPTEPHLMEWLVLRPLRAG